MKSSFNHFILSFGLVALSGLTSSAALACSAFRMPVSEGRVLVGRNFDWDYGHGLMVINKRGVAKTAFGLHSSDTASWTSKYGSLTFNQAGRELPYGGMNEKGLMIEVLWLGWTAWPVTPAPSINEVQWIQNQLDQRASVQDLISHLNDVRILSVFAKVHFFVCDSSGECATVEGLGDQLEVHTGATLPLAALTNDTYEASVNYVSNTLKNSCAAVPAGSTRSLDRFARSACAAQTVVAGESLADESSRVDAALNSVAQDGYTKWQIVYDLTDKMISIRTHDAPVSKTVSLSEFDFSCASPVKILDLNAVVSRPSDVSSSFTDYTQSANRSIVEASLLRGFAQLPKQVVDKIVIFPESLACVAP
jgi:penicillin V acylase-like amidase (Ntn superfamily)